MKPTWDKRYILFGYDYYYERGGQSDEVGRFNTRQELEVLLIEKFEHCEILDLLTGKWIDADEFQNKFEIKTPEKEVNKNPPDARFIAVNLTSDEKNKLPLIGFGNPELNKSEDKDHSWNDE